MIPKKTGVVLFEQLKKNGRYKEIPIRMLTGLSGVLETLDDHMEETFE